MLRPFSKFLLFSGGGWLLDCTLFLILSRSFKLPLFTSNFISSSCAALAVFTVSRIFVFTPAGTNYFMKTVIYFGYTVLIILTASALIDPARAISQSIAARFDLNLSVTQALFMAKVFITPPQLMANFFMSRFLVEKIKIN